MWLPTSPRSYSGLGATRPPDRAGRTFIIAAVALLLGAGAGGASMFAVVAALTAPPRDGPDASKTATPATAARPTPVAPPQSENAPARVLATPAPAKPPQQAEITPAPQPVKPWPDALSRAHSADAATPPASSQSAPAPAAAPADRQAGRDRPFRPNAHEATADKSGTEDRTTAWRSSSKPSNGSAETSKQHTTATSRDAPPAAETKAAGPGTDDRPQVRDPYGNRRFRVGEVTDDGQDRTPPKPDRDARGVTPKTGAHARRQDSVDDDRQGWGDSSGKSRRAIVEPRERDDLDDERGRWGGRDNWGAGPFGGLFGLFGRRDTWRGDAGGWDND
jgi:hypothetical protein